MSGPVHTGGRVWSLLRGALAAGKITGPVVYDAWIATICLAHGLRELWLD